MKKELLPLSGRERNDESADSSKVMFIVKRSDEASLVFIFLRVFITILWRRYFIGFLSRAETKSVCYKALRWFDLAYKKYIKSLLCPNICKYLSSKPLSSRPC